MAIKLIGESNQDKKTIRKIKRLMIEAKTVSGVISSKEELGLSDEQIAKKYGIDASEIKDCTRKRLYRIKHDITALLCFGDVFGLRK